MIKLYTSKCGKLMELSVRPILIKDAVFIFNKCRESLILGRTFLYFNSSTLLVLTNSKLILGASIRSGSNWTAN
jgi:hypothetical protein